jgi:superfamily II DNA or RNA helicase
MYDSEKCYITNNLYYPKKYLNVPFVLNTCKYKSGKKDIVLARETENHIIFPRHYYSKKEIEENDIEIVEEEITFPRIGFKSKIKWRSDSQRLAHDSFSRAENGILNLNPAKGKTVQAIKKIEELGVPTLIVVHNSYLAEQWRRRIEDPNICLEWNGEIGKIGDGEFNWKHEVCIATIQTLISRLKRKTLPLEEFKNWFGCIIYDEVHHLGAAEFSQVGDLCWGNRYGLSATSRRVDNMDLVVRAHIDGIIYSDLTWDLFPEVFFKKTPSLFNDSYTRLK